MSPAYSDWYEEAAINAMRVQSSVYVVAFDSGVVKVGYSAKPKQRLESLRNGGRAFGIEMTERWISPAHAVVNARANERLLVAFCAERTPRASGRKHGEYFRGVRFVEVREYAQGLDFPPGEVPLDRMMAHMLARA